MATYTDTGKLRTDTWRVGDDEGFEQILVRASVMAKEFIDSYLYGIYTVPFSTGASTPSTVREISDLITRHAAQAFQLKQKIIISEHQNKDDELGLAIKWLNDIIKGKASIIGESRLTTRGPEHNLDGYHHIFDIDGPLNQLPDPDLIEKIQDERK